MKPTRRIPNAAALGPSLIIAAAILLDSQDSLPTWGFVPMLVAAVALYYFNFARMIRELRSVTGNHEFSWWPVVVPIYQMYWWTVVLQAEVAKAKAMRGAPEARDSFIYLCLPLRSFTADLNDLAD